MLRHLFTSRITVEDSDRGKLGKRIPCSIVLRNGLWKRIYS